MSMIQVKEMVASKFKATEALKTLRTNLIFSGESVKAVALTSVKPNEGKSTIAFQLAASMAESGKKTLLIDADLRNSALLTTLNVTEKVDGLSHYLTGLSNANDLINTTDVANLYIMFAGVRVPNSAELLGGEKFKRLITASKASFDFIIVDTAPLGLVIDSAVISPALDGTLLVIDASDNSYKQERKVIQQIQKIGGKMLGAVLNRVDFKEGGKYGGYYGKYGYGYGYGSSSDDKDSKK